MGPAAVGLRSQGLSSFDSGRQGTEWVRGFRQCCIPTCFLFVCEKLQIFCAVGGGVGHLALV